MCRSRPWPLSVGSRQKRFGKNYLRVQQVGNSQSLAEHSEQSLMRMLQCPLTCLQKLEKERHTNETSNLAAQRRPLLRNLESQTALTEMRAPVMTSQNLRINLCRPTRVSLSWDGKLCTSMTRQRHGPKCRINLFGRVNERTTIANVSRWLQVLGDPMFSARTGWIKADCNRFSAPLLVNAARFP